MSDPIYEVFALRYATMQERTAGQNFLFPDDHAAPMPIDYFVWAIRGEGRLIVVDTGFGPAGAERRGRTLIRRPVEALATIGIDAAAVADVVITHLHWDHAGGMPDFPAATFHLQDAEMAFATGRCMCHRWLRFPMDVDDVTYAVRQVYAGRVRFHDGTATIAPGITLHLVGGHSGGMQIVRVPTVRGWVVLASDAVHFNANLRTENPFPAARGSQAHARGLPDLPRARRRRDPHHPRPRSRGPAALPDGVARHRPGRLIAIPPLLDHSLTGGQFLPARLRRCG